MEFGIILLLTLVCLVLFIKKRRIDRFMEEVVIAIEAKRPYLFSDRYGFARNKRALRFSRALNDLIEDDQRAKYNKKIQIQELMVLLSHLKEAIVVIDRRNIIRVANDSLYDLLQYKGNVIGQRLESIIQSAGFLEYVRKKKSGGDLGTVMIDILLDGDIRWLDLNGGAIQLEDSESEELYLFVLHDITKIVRLERMRQSFVADLSHELKTPVTIIQGYSDTLMEDFEDLSAEARSRFLKKIQNNVIRLNGLLDDLLTLSRLESNPESLEKIPYSLTLLVEEVYDNYQSRVEKAGKTFELLKDDAAFLIPMNAGRMTQVLQNFLENALRHAKDSTWIRLGIESGEGDVICYVQDNGCGIPTRDLSRIFERFYRVDKGRSRELGGTGLGLSIVKHIVQQHGGQVFVESELGEGTKIGFKVPQVSI